MTDFKSLRIELLDSIEGVKDLDSLERLRVTALGKKGKITAGMKTLGGLDPDERRAQGAALNALKEEIAQAIAERTRFFKNLALNARLLEERLDMTLPARPEANGRIHPISQTMDELLQIFGAMGFDVAEGPDVEDDFHNFAALNIPPEHPARQMHDTFYFPPGTDGERKLLRTHTSPVQIRTMQTTTPPIRIIAPGRTYRRDSDITHTPMFHQIEGLAIDRKTHMGHLKGCLIEFCRLFFELDDVPLRFRPSFFPFTEPSAEVDIGCERRKDDIRVGAGVDWLEILGCGMVHPKVLENCGIDSNEYQGFAFGLGVERVAMLKYGIPDLRTFFDADLRWLHHYGFLPMDVPNIGVPNIGVGADR